MTSFQPLSPTLAALAAEARPALAVVAPTAIVLAVVLVLLTAVSLVALVIEVRRDGYGLERPRPMSAEFPWQVTWAPRRRSRAARPWRIQRVAGAGRR